MPAKQVKLETVPVDKLRPNAKNPRTHSDSQIEELRASIREFGFLNPLLIDGKYNVIAGHGRLKAALLEGMTELPCVSIEGLTKTQIKAYTIADNKLALNAGWNDDWLKADLTELKDDGFDLNTIGFSDDEFNDLMYEEPEPEEDDFNIEEELASPARTAPGDVWQLDQHRVMCGDSTSQEQVDKLMNGKKADLIVTDPPYNVDYEGGTGLKIKNDNMGDTEFRSFLTAAFKCMISTTKAGGAIYCFHAIMETHWVIPSLREAGWHIPQCLIWVKNALVMGRQDYQWMHEPILYGWKPGASHYFVNERNNTTVINEDKPRRNAEHPTMKPIVLCARLIENSSKPKQLVQDLFGGSGSVLIAAEQLDRACYTMELDTKYCDVIIKRWEEYTGKKAVRLNG